MENQTPVENRPSRGRRFGQIMLSLLPVAIMFTIQNIIPAVGSIILVLNNLENFDVDDPDALSDMTNVLTDYSGIFMLIYTLVALAVFIPWYCKKYVHAKDIGKNIRGIGPKFFFCAVFAILGAQMFALGLIYISEFLFSDIYDMYNDIMEQAGFSTDTGDADIWMQLAVIFLIPIVEELVFRGLCTSKLEVCNFSRRFTYFFPAIVFALLHGNPLQIVYVFALALILGYARLEKHTIIFTCFLHILYNFLGTVPNFDNLFDSLPKFIPVILTISGLAIVAASFLIVRSGNKTRIA